MLLADFGADVVRVDRPGQVHPDVLCRRKRSVQIDLKSPSSKAVLERMLSTTDVLIDPFRPGVLEAVGLDPERLRKKNENLIVARLTGFRTDGKACLTNSD
jgi:alpha-methylacyl-CoA racemase